MLNQHARSGVPGLRVQTGFLPPHAERAQATADRNPQSEFCWTSEQCGPERFRPFLLVESRSRILIAAGLHTTVYLIEARKITRRYSVAASLTNMVGSDAVRLAGKGQGFGRICNDH